MDERGEPRLILEDFLVRAGDSFVSEKVSLTLHAGEIGWLTGPLGSGKSLIFEALAGVRRPGVSSEGTARTPGAAGEELALVPQDPRLVVLPTDRVGDFLLAGSRERGERERGEAFLAELGLAAARLWRLEFRDLSSSERHRAFLVSALLSRSPLLLYDGAGEGLDPNDRRAVARLLRRALDEGRSLLLTARSYGALDLPASRHAALAPDDRTPAIPLLRRSEIPPDAEEDRAPLLEVTRLRVARRSRRWFGAGRAAFPVTRASLFVRKRESVVLLGPAGSGKSTFLEAIAGFVQVQSGRIVFARQDITPLRGLRAQRLRRKIQLVFHDATAVLDEELTVERHLLESAQVRGKRPTERAMTEPAEWLARLGLPRRLLELPTDFLSAGEAQRVHWAQSLASSPELVLLDAPRVAGVDSDGGEMAALLSSQKQLGTSFLIATNEPTVARALGDRTGIFYAGRVIELGLTSEVLDRPAHPATAALLSGELHAPHLAPAKALGCPYAPSCPRKSARCEQQDPELEPHPERPRRSGRHRVACFHPLP